VDLKYKQNKTDTLKHAKLRATWFMTLILNGFRGLLQRLELTGCHLYARFLFTQDLPWI